MSDYKSDFVIITALVNPEFKELQRVVKKLGGKMVEENKTGIYQGEISNGGKTFYFYAASQVSPGMVSAATLATRMIELYRPKYVVMLGIAAGFKKKRLTEGSILIADFVANYQQGKIIEGDFERDSTGLPLDVETNVYFNRYKDEIIEGMNEELAFCLRTPIKAHLGPIVSGSQVIASQKVMDDIQRSYRKVVGIDMEGYAIFQAATAAMEPKPKPILIKSVSDYGNKSKNDEYQRLAAHTSALFFMQFAFKALTSLSLCTTKHLGLELVAWKHQEDKKTARFTSLINDCRAGSIVKFVSVTGRRFLFPHKTESAKEDIFEEAIQRGVKFHGIVLDPESNEAKCRSDFESPGIKSTHRRLLQRDAKRVQEKLRKRNNPFKKELKENLKLHYSEIGLSFGLWLFDNVAMVEPLHFGKRKEKRSWPESPLCGFSSIWIERTALEFELLEDHFDKLWQRSRPFWPKDK